MMWPVILTLANAGQYAGSNIHGGSSLYDGIDDMASLSPAEEALVNALKKSVSDKREKYDIVDWDTPAGLSWVIHKRQGKLHMRRVDELDHRSVDVIFGHNGTKVQHSGDGGTEFVVQIRGVHQGMDLTCHTQVHHEDLKGMGYTCKSMDVYINEEEKRRPVGSLSQVLNIEEKSGPRYTPEFEDLPKKFRESMYLYLNAKGLTPEMAEYIHKSGKTMDETAKADFMEGMIKALGDHNERDKFNDGNKTLLDKFMEDDRLKQKLYPGAYSPLEVSKKEKPELGQFRKLRHWLKQESQKQTYDPLDEKYDDFAARHDDINMPLLNHPSPVKNRYSKKNGRIVNRMAYSVYDLPTANGLRQK